MDLPPIEPLVAGGGAWIGGFPSLTALDYVVPMKKGGE
jgi:hypothetical protein